MAKPLFRFADLRFMLSKRRDLAAARRFFRQAIATNGVTDRVAIDKSGANLAGLMAVNVILKFTWTRHLVTIRQVKHLNNILEQNHRFIKRITARPLVICLQITAGQWMAGFKAIHSAAATIAGIQVVPIIRKDQLAANGTTPFQQLAALAA
jgi:putative transposase